MTEPDLPPETPEARKARQFASLRTLGDLGMDLAKSAHGLAKQQLTDPPRARPKDVPDYAATFATMSRAVRQAVAIEIRLDAPARTRPAFRLARLADPRRILLCHAFREAIAGHPDRASRIREIETVIDQHLEADPDQQIPIEKTIATLCNTLELDLDLSRIPDALLYYTPASSPLPPARAAPQT